jgi:NADPH:quinone reductase-like Zn-dependent oxidoreductase
MKMIPTIISRRPFTAENDLAGIVVLSASSEFKPGDRVFGYLHSDIQRRIRQGALNQYTRLPASSIAPLPSNISFTQGSGFALAGVTALQALVDCGNVQEGQSVFINGGSSSVGAFAIQIAKAKGCKVVASASGGNEELVRGLGADDVGHLPFLGSSN